MVRVSRVRLVRGLELERVRVRELAQQSELERQLELELEVGLELGPELVRARVRELVRALERGRVRRKLKAGLGPELALARAVTLGTPMLGTPTPGKPTLEQLEQPVRPTTALTPL
jgi:hypothetical protein